MQHVRFAEPWHQPDAYLSGARAAYSRFTRDDRLMRRIIQSMRREYKKYGRLRVTILPVAQAADEAPEDEEP